MTVGQGPNDVSVNPNTNRIYITNFKSNSVSIIDGKNGRVVSTIPVGIVPQGVTVNPRTNLAYVANSNSNTVSVINGNSARIIKISS